MPNLTQTASRAEGNTGNAPAGWLTPANAPILARFFPVSPPYSPRPTQSLKSKFLSVVFLLQCTSGLALADYTLPLDNLKELSPQSCSDVVFGFAIVEPLDGVSAIKLYGREFKPLYLRCGNKLNQEQGTIEFKFRPSSEFKSPDKVSISSFFYSGSGSGSIKIGINHGRDICYPVFYLSDTPSGKDNYGIYQPFELEKGKWHTITACWNPTEMFLMIDGKLVQKLDKRFPLSFGGDFVLGGNPDNSLSGHISDLKIENNCRKLLSGYSFSLRTDRHNPLYRCGELATFNAVALKDMQPLKDGEVEFIFTNDGLNKISRKTVLLAQNDPVIKMTMNEPGFIRCRAIVKKGGQQINEMTVAAGFDVEKILPGQVKPTDFDQFWAEGLKRLESIPEDARITPADDLSSDELEVFRISFANVDNTRIYGFMSIPRQAAKPLPAVVVIPGAGIGVNDPRPYFNNRTITMFLNVHAYEAIPDTKALEKVYAEAYRGTDYCDLGVENAEKYYFRRTFIGFYRAIEWLARHPDFDKKNLGITGSSQGGGSSLVMAGLNPRISYVVANIPGLCDLGSQVKGRMPGWPLLSVKFPNRSDVLKTGSYYDASSFARQIKCPAVVIAGYIDPICSPSSIYAMFNSIPSSDKRIIGEPDMAHGWPLSYNRECQKMIDELTRSK
jgi:cephalosporin-C deacetylase-like acetyl esterase